MITSILSFIIFSSNILAINNVNAQSQDKFLWGAATSSMQTEGGIYNNDWNKFTRDSDIRDSVWFDTNVIKNEKFFLQPPRDGVKFQDPRYYQTDFNNAKNMGMNSFRIGIEWASIEPQNDQWNMSKLNEYREMIIAMKQDGLNPVISLNHFSLPLWVLTPPEGRNAINFVPPGDPYHDSLRGWANEQTVSEFVEYISFVVNNLKDEVDYWLTINEPVSTYIGLGYVAGAFPPGFILDGFAARDVLHNQILAHVKAYDKISEIDNVDADGDGISKMVSFTHYMFAVKPKPGGSNADIKAAKNFEYFMNDYFLNAVVNGEEDLNYLNTNPPQRQIKLEMHNKSGDDWRNKVDFIAPQYYRIAEVKNDDIINARISYFGGSFDSNLAGTGYDGPLTDLGWPIYPQGIYEILMNIKQKWDKPILITENGVADRDDKFRAQFITSHLQQVKRAIEDGANVIGYLHWSMTDNYELAFQYEPRGKFGLYEVDRTGREMITDAKKIIPDILFPGTLPNPHPEIINAGSILPNSNCLIDTVLLELLVGNGIDPSQIVSTTSKGERPASNGFGIYAPPIGPRPQVMINIDESHENTGNLETRISYSYLPQGPQPNIIEYRLHYFFKGEDCNNDHIPDLQRQKTKGADAYELIMKGSGSGPLTDKALDRAIKKYGTFTSDGKDLVEPVKDITPPTILTPSSPVISEATGPTGAIVNYEVSADDDQDFPISASCNPHSGSMFPLGDTEVMCQAQDSSGNVGVSKFIIRVQDTTPPDTRILDVKDGNKLKLNPNDGTPSNEITVSFDGSDIVGVKGFECSLDGSVFISCVNPTSYTKLGFGNHNVQVRAVDTSGNKDPTPATFNWVVLTPKQATEKLLSTVNGLKGVNSAVKTSLDVQLNQAIKVLGDRSTSNDKLACVYLGSFITSVNTYKATGLLTTLQADNLKQQAQAIQKANGCGNLSFGIPGGIILPF